MSKKRIFGFNVLTCMITIGDPDPIDPSINKVKYFLKEVNNIEIEDSYSTLINKATVSIPRGTILESVENDSDGVRFRELVGPTANSIYQRGQRITIWLGYDDDGVNRNNKKMFDGYIVSVESGNPYTLHCEDLGYMLKKNAIQPYTSTKKGVSINDVMPIILKGTGLKLHPLSERMDIKIGQIILQKSKSAAEVLEQWKKFGLLSFIKFYQGVPHLAISRTFFSVKGEETLVAGEDDDPPMIDFQDNVVVDDLKIMDLETDTLALTAISLYPDNSMLELTIIQNKSKPTEFEIVNEKRLSKKQLKQKFANDIEDIVQNYKNTRNVQDRFDLSAYSVRTYHEYNLDRDDLIKNAKAAFSKISQTGIEGTVTVFGDFGLRAASMVKLFDARNPERNGVYIISEVHTTFGVGGYRQKIKIPYKRSSLKKGG